MKIRILLLSLGIIIGPYNTYLSAATPPPTVNPAAAQQIEKMLCYPHADGLTKIIDLIVAALRNETIKIIRNPKKVPHADTRTKAEEWVTSLITFITTSVSDQLHHSTFTAREIQEYYASLIYCIQLAEKALDAKFIPEKLPSLDKEIAKKAIADISLVSKETVAKKKPDTIEEEKKTLTTGMPPQMISLIALIDVQPYLVLNHLLEKVQQEQGLLAESIRSYGISSLNKICRKTEQLYKKLWASNHMEWTIALAGAGAAAFVTTKFCIPLASNLLGISEDKQRQSSLIGQVAGQFLYNAAVASGNAVWTPASKVLAASKLKAHRFWNWLKGEELREMLDGFEVLREEDCEGRELPPIGIEHVLDVILSNVEGALTRLEQGDPAPFQDIQKAFILTGKSGSGKTFAVQQLKIKFAKLNRKLQRKIVYQALTPLHLKSGALPALIDLAKQRDVALILWIDELHLTQPVKDGDTLTLYDFLSTEVINKQNLPVWIIGASNEPGRFDNALVRAGRFEVINIPDFTFEDRINFFAFYAQQEGLMISENNLRLISLLTQGCPPALLMKIILSAKQHGEVLTEDWMLDAILRLVIRVTPGFESLSPHAQNELATYIMGKAITKMVVHQKLPDTSTLNPEPVLLVTAQAIQPPLKELALLNLSSNNVVTNANIEAPRMFGKVAIYEQREGLPFNATTAGKEEEIKMLLGGSCAQQVLLGYTNLEYQREDIGRAQKLCEELELNGLLMDSLSLTRQGEVKSAAEQRFHEYRRVVTDIITTHLAALKLSVEMLMLNPKNPFLFGSEIRRIIQNPEGMRAEIQKRLQALRNTPPQPPANLPTQPTQAAA